MATTGYGSPYVESSDLVSAWPATSQSVADRIDDVAMKGNGVNAQSGTTYTTVLTDAGKVVTLENASPVTVTIPTNASVAYETGTRINFLNLGAGTVTLAGAGGVTVNGDTLTIDQYGASSAVKIDTDEWVVLPFSSGVGSAEISDTPTGSYTGYQYWTYTASGTLTVDTAGFADVLVVGGGGGSGYPSASRGGGGGAGGMLVASNAYLTAGSHTIVVGAGGAGQTTSQGPGFNGTTSRAGFYYGVGGASTANRNHAGNTGGSGGGGNGSDSSAGLPGGSGTSGQGNDGGDGVLNNAAGGGGGAGAAGSNAITLTGGAGGAGLANSFTGSSVTYAGGGGGAGTTGGAGGSGGGGAGATGNTSGTAGTANTGGGGGGSDVADDGASGGSGIVVVRVKV